MKKFIIQTAIFLGLLLAIALLVKENQHLSKESARKDQNIAVLNQQAHEYKTKDGKNAVKVQALTYTKKELKTYEPELVRTVKNSNVTNIQSIAQVTAQTVVKVPFAVHDTVTKTDTLNCFEYKDNYISLSGCLNDSLKVETFDTLTYIVERVPKRFLFIKYGVKAINLHAVSSNPYIRLTGSKYIEVK